MAPLRPDFILSDSHFGHRNIIDYCDRPFDHEAIMIKRWRSIIRPSHTVLHLGDLFFSRKGGLKRFSEEIAPQLSGHKYLLLGNHDARDVDYESLGFTVLKPYQIQYRNFTVSFDHYPKILHDNQRRVHFHGHIHNHPYSHGEMVRPNNINVSVEVINYTPQRFTKLANAAILARKHGRGGRYYNSKGYRSHLHDTNRRAA